MPPLALPRSPRYFSLFVRSLVKPRQVGEQVAKSTGGNYPNALAIVDCIKFGLTANKQVSQTPYTRFAFTAFFLEILTRTHYVFCQVRTVVTGKAVVVVQVEHL